MIFTQDYNFQEAFGEFVGGFSVFLTGVVMVFFALVLLIFLIKIIGMCVAKIENKPQPTVESAPVTPVQETPVVQETQKMDDLELVAVITAAIAASLGTTTDQLVVRSLRKTNRRVR